jgi:LEA14-like dessication related protein
MRMVPRPRSAVRASCETAPLTAFLVIACCSLLAACTPRFEKPALSVASVEFLGGNLLQQNFQVTFNIHNPNDRTLPVSGLSAELRVGGDPIATGSSARAFVVPAFGDMQFDMTITADLALGLLKLAKRSDALDYELNGVVSIDLPFFRSLPFHQSGSFSLAPAPR